MPIVIHPPILTKLQNKNPPVTRREVEQCFENKAGRLLKDTREKHKTNPPTLWFIAKTNKNRLLKVVYMQLGADVIVKTAYDPNVEEIYIYNKLAARTF
jgi:hypothetical protein